MKTIYKPGENNVTFQSEGETMAGHLFLPPEFKTGQTLPGIIVTGSWLTVKEQMPDLYARKLAEKGFAALTFDCRFWGESGGEPRQYESPQNKVKDIKNAFSFLETLDIIDSKRLGALSICASAGYMATAVAETTNIKSFVAVAPWLHDSELVKLMYGGAEGVGEKIALGKKAFKKYKETGEVDYVLAASATDKKAAMFGAFDYYLTTKRGAVPEWKNQFAVLSWEEWLTFTAMPQAAKITISTLFVHSEQAAIPDGARKFFKDISGKKDFFWTQGSQFDFYDQEPIVNKSIALASLHFANL